jgi:hypothetical protein
VLQSFFSFIDARERERANDKMRQARSNGADVSVSPDTILASILTNCRFMSMAINRSLDYSKWQEQLLMNHSPHSPCTIFSSLL